MERDPEPYIPYVKLLKLGYIKPQKSQNGNAPNKLAFNFLQNKYYCTAVVNSSLHQRALHWQYINGPYAVGSQLRSVFIISTIDMNVAEIASSCQAIKIKLKNWK